MPAPTPSRVFHRSLTSDYPMVVSGDGAYVIDSHGKRYLDGSGGAAVSCLGHSHPKVIAAVQAQVAKLAHVHTSFFTNEPMEALADWLITDAPAGFSHVFFVQDGSEAVESALKLSRQYFVERGEPERHIVITRRQSYHGNTLGALSVGGNMAKRPLHQPLMNPSVVHVSPCYAYRGQFAGESDEVYTERLAAELHTAISAAPPNAVMAFLAETVVGASLGAVPPVAGYFKRIREVCDRHGVLLIADEVMCGMGRTGQSYAIADERVAPDLLTIAKGLGGGYQPIGALLVSQTIHDTLRDGSGAFAHSHTYNGHLVACAAALAVQQVIREEDLLANVRAMSTHLEACLTERFGNHAQVGNIRGRGLFWGVELVGERATKMPFPAGMKLAARIKSAAREGGLLCYASSGNFDGRDGDNVILAPPFNVGPAILEEAVDKLGLAIDAALQQSRA